MANTQTSKAPRRRRKKHENALIDAIDAGVYRPLIELGDSVPVRTAAFLNWAADRYPGVYVPYNWLYKAVMGFKKTPRLDSEEVQRFRSKMGSVKRHLRKRFERGTAHQAGLGVRATHCDDDLCETTYEAATRRLGSAATAAREIAALIREPNKLKPHNREHYDRSSPMVKRLASPAQLSKLLRAPTRKLKSKP